VHPLRRFDGLIQGDRSSAGRPPDKPAAKDAARQVA